MKNSFESSVPISATPDREILEQSKSLEEKRFEIVVEFVKSKTNEEVLACLERNFPRAEKIGEGKNAEVFSLSEKVFDKLCVKRLRKGVPKTNSPREEFIFQAKAKEAGIKTPLAIMQLKDMVTREEYLIMEKIKGYSLAELFAQPAKIADDFDLEKFINALDSQVAKMNDAGIFHRDLHEGNIMVNEKNEPVIIDFGQAFEWGGDKQNMEVIYFEENPILYDARTQKATISRVPGWYPKDREDSYDGRLIGGELLRLSQKLRAEFGLHDKIRKGELDK